MLLKNKNARAVLATALAVITIILMTLSVSAYDCGNDTSGCYDNDNDGFCDSCGSDGAVHEHYTEFTGHFEATCTEGGGSSYVCTDCGEEFIYYTSDPLGHSYEDGVCTSCGDTDPDVGGDTDPDEGGDYEEHIHNYVLGGGYPATCTENGKWWYQCACGDIKEEYPSATGHTYGDWYLNDSTLSTCKWEYWQHCQNNGGNCDSYEYKYEEHHRFVGDTNSCVCGEYTCNHDWAGSNVLSVPTCTTAGVTEYWCISCQNNGVITDKIERIEAFGHGDMYWKSLGDTCAEYCGRCNVKVNTINHFTSSDPATPCIKEYSSTQIVSGHYCDRCKTYINVQETKTTLANVLIVTIDENYGTRQQFDYDAFMSYKYIYIENKRTEYVSTFTFEVRSAKNMSVRFDAILNYIIPVNDAILIDIENEHIYSHEKKHRIESVTLNGYEAWKQYGDVYRLTATIKAFDKYWQKGAFPSGSVMSAEIDVSVHGDLIISPKYTTTIPAGMFFLGEIKDPFRIKAYPAGLSVFIDNLRESPITINLEYDELTAKQVDGSALQFFRTVKADHDSAMNSNEYAQGFNDAIQSVINDNPVQGLFQGIWSSVMLFVTILGSGISIGGIALSGVISTAVIVLIAYFVIKVVR